LSAIFGPPLMTSLYGEFSKPEAAFHFPGAAFMMGSIFALVSLVIAWVYLRREQANVN